MDSQGSATDPEEDIPVNLEKSGEDNGEAGCGQAGIIMYKQEQTKDPNEDDTTVEFYAVLRNGYTFNSAAEDLCVFSDKDLILKMRLIGNFDEKGWLFKHSHKLKTSTLPRFLYKYVICEKEKLSVRREELISNSNKCWRKLNLVRSANKVFQQFDDICIASTTHWVGNKRTEICGLRPKFLEVMLSYMLKCNNIDLQCHRETLTILMNTIAVRWIYDFTSDSVLAIESNCTAEDLGKALNKVLEKSKGKEPLQHVLATALIVEMQNLHLTPSSMDKLFKIVKMNSPLSDTLTDVASTTKREICRAVEHLLTLACEKQHPNAAVWFLALYFVLLPARTDSAEDEELSVDSFNLNWVSQHALAQKELLTMVELHGTNIKHRKFADYVLNMFSVDSGDPNVLTNLDHLPKDLLNKIPIWQGKNVPKRQKFLERVSSCQKYWKIMSTIVALILKPLQWNMSDWEHLVTEPQYRDLFSVLNERQKENPSYMDKFEAHARQLIQKSQGQMNTLLDGFLKDSVSSKVMYHVLENKETAVCICSFLTGEDTKKKFGEILKTAELDITSFKKNQERIKQLIDICDSIKNVIPVDVNHLMPYKSTDLSTEERPLKSLMKQVEEKGDIHRFAKIEFASQSTYFNNIWTEKAELAKRTGLESQSISLNDVYEKIYTPAFHDLKVSYEDLKNLSMPLQLLDCKLDKLRENDMKVMENVFNESTCCSWIGNTQLHIGRYKKFCNVMKPAKLIHSLKNVLSLKGDFGVLENILHVDLKCLKDLTSEIEEVATVLSIVDGDVAAVLQQFTNCAAKKFISWIKNILTDSRELNAFVELASISAGENDMDIDKVSFFRDAVLACGPIIFELEETSGFCELMGAIEKLREPIKKDPKLEKKLRDSFLNKDWLQIAYDTHGSVERSSLVQTSAINQSGVFIIKLPAQENTVSLEHCITLKMKEKYPDQKEEQYKVYNFANLKELQNKLMLITANETKGGKDEITRFVEVFELILLTGKLLLKLHDAGHVLFMDWKLNAYCDPGRPVTVLVDFGIAGVTITGRKPLSEELKGLCESMHGCLEEWKQYMENQRDEYYYLNYFSAKQLVTLCCNMAKLQREEKLETKALNLLSYIKENITTADVQESFRKALMTPALNSTLNNEAESPTEFENYLLNYPELIKSVIEAGFKEEEAKAGIMHCKTSSEVNEDTVLDCLYKLNDDNAWVEQWCARYEEDRENVLQNQMKFKGSHSSNQSEFSFKKLVEEEASMFDNLASCHEKVVFLWRAYCKKLSGLVSEKYIGFDLVGETLQLLAKSENIVKRKIGQHLNCYLEKGKPNLIACKDVEMLPVCLSLYKDEEQPLPTYDEILICSSETTAEDVELIIRRAVQSGSRHEKVYCLLNADHLDYDVSKKLESVLYQMLQRESDISQNYNLVIFCNATAHRSYILTALEPYQRTIPPCNCTDIQEYLKEKHLYVKSTSDASETGFSKFKESEFQQKTKIIFSEHAGMGKSLYVANLRQKAEAKLKDAGYTYKTIQLTESRLKIEHIILQLQCYEDNPTDDIPRIFHFDVPPVVSKGLYGFLVQLFVLRCFHSPNGSTWRCKDCHLYLVEYTQRKHKNRQNFEISSEMEDSLLTIFPAVKCLSPKQTQSCLELSSPFEQDIQLMDQSQFRSEAFQRTYQYLKRHVKFNLQKFRFIPGNPEDSPKEWLKFLLDHYETKDPSWRELRNFTHFLNVQLKKCEDSIFCSDQLQDDLTGFKNFVVKFMITMSKDFSIRSIKASEEKDSTVKVEDDLWEFQLIRQWEHEAHPYIMFNADGESMTFLGFHIRNQDAIDVHTGNIVEKDVITRQLFNQLKQQGVPFNLQFEKLTRKEQLDILCNVLGVSSNVSDPDQSYQLTLENVMKIAAIHLRFQCDIPVIIMGETGCGKTRLVEFMCELLKAGKEGKNMIVSQVHGGTTAEDIYRKVRDAADIAKENEAKGMYTVLFFDEANTTEAVYAIKEVICDKTVNGEQINAPQLKVVAACNPYRKHTKGVIKQLERAGLGYRVHCRNTEEKFGEIPMRQLVYRVQPLPPSISPFVWDFGQLNQSTLDLYIMQMVKSFLTKQKLSSEYEQVFVRVISTSQRHITQLLDECRMVSLRDVERCMKTVMWFYEQREILFPLIDCKKQDVKTGIDSLIRSLILAVGVCYYVSLEHRKVYVDKVAVALSISSEDFCQEIDLCQDVFIDNVDYPDSTAKNDALKENVFMMIVCMNLRMPLFLVGKPGSSKSLAKTIAANAMQGKSARSDLFKNYKQAQLVSFQCSPHSKPDGIISTFRQCAQIQKGQNLDEFVSVLVLDEIGLAEDSPKMPLKALHPLLENGCVNEEKPEEFKKVGFFGISNWSLDPAKMNRGILVLRTCPGEDELVRTAEFMCGCGAPKNKETNAKMKELIQKLARFYNDVLTQQKRNENEFFGLRDYYSLIKVIISYAQKNDGVPSDEDLAKAVQRNFGGLDSLNCLDVFQKYFPLKGQTTSTITLLKENLDTEASAFTSRYLLLLTTNNAALSILKMMNLIDENKTEIIFGSGFPHDQDYSQVCRSVNKVKTCMEIGRPVVLLNIQNLYESLYDALNQCYVTLGGSYYVDLGLGTHRVKCRVQESFRLIVIEEKKIVYEQFPAPLLNRLEKHSLEISTIFPEEAKQLQAELQEWISSLVVDNNSQSNPSSEGTDKKRISDIIIGYTDDTCASVILQCCSNILSPGWDLEKQKDILENAKMKLIQCATPDSILRAKKKNLQNYEAIQDMYFMHQTHTNLADVLHELQKNHPAGICMEVTTFSRLLNQRDVKLINKKLTISRKQSSLVLLHEFSTERDFDDTLSNFFNNGDEYRLLLIQSYFDDPKQSQRLLSCARHHITNFRRKLKTKKSFNVVLLTRLPRVSGGCGYTGLSGDDWISLHLDELVPVQGFSADMSLLHTMTVSEILRESICSMEYGDCGADSTLTENKMEKEMLIDTVFLIKRSIPKAVLQLRDKEDNTERAKKRIVILHDLLHTDSSIQKCFGNTVEKRMVSLLSAQEKMKNMENWVIAQASSQTFVQEGLSFRHMLWIQMEDTVASALAQILAVVDGDNNLDHIAVGQPSHKTDLWLKIFQEDDILKIPVLSKSPDAQISVLSTNGDKDKSYSCQFPFHWVVKARLEQIWLKVIELEGPSPKPKLKHIKKFEELISFPWIHEIKKEHALFAIYAQDLIDVSIRGCFDSNKSFSEAVVALSQCLYTDLTEDDPKNVSLPWLHVTYEYMHNNHQIFCTLSQHHSLLMAPEAKEATQATRLILEKLQPSNDKLKDLDSCKEWMKRVKSLSTSVELVTSEDSLVQQHGENGEELLKQIRLLWQKTHIVYLLMDHLLHDETKMEKKLLTIVVRNFIHLWKKINEEHGMEKNIALVTEVLQQCSSNACKVFLEGQTHCLYCGKEFTEDNTAELSCGHMFCMSCLKEDNPQKCKKCQKEITSRKRCEPVKCDTILKVNKFRRKCNSFFVEFVQNYFVGDNIKLSEGVVNMLIKYVADTTKQQVNSMEPLAFHKCMRPSAADQSLLLKILLRCSKDHIQDFITEAVKSVKNVDDFYFMVVRTTEDHIYKEAQESLITKATESLRLEPRVFENITKTAHFEYLYTIARFRFGITVAADIIGLMLLQPDVYSSQKKEGEDLLQKLQNLILHSENPWIQIFLFRNLCRMHGFKIVQHIYQVKELHWILPSELKKEPSVVEIDHFIIYDVMVADETDVCFPVCLTLAALKQIVSDPTSKKNKESLLAQIQKEEKWKALAEICVRMGDDCLGKVSEHLSQSHQSSLAQIVLHTAVVAHLSTAPEMYLLRSLCFSPDSAKNLFFPSMPDLLYESTTWEKRHSTEQLWKCKCGQPVILENCGNPSKKSICPFCKSDIGGTDHKAVEGFTRVNISDTEGQGHILGDPSNRKPAGSERNLSGVSLCLTRALIHSSMIWGAAKNLVDVQGIMKNASNDVGTLLYCHLQKDIELLAAAIGKSTEDAERAVHMFLKYIMQAPTEASSNINIYETDTREKRVQWEDAMLRKIKMFFVDFEKKLSDLHSDILERGASYILVQIIYSNTPPLKGLSTSGIFNLPQMWKFEQRMTIQLLAHLVEQEGGKEKFPVLFELLQKHQHIKYIQHLPQILGLQQRLVLFFHYTDLQDWTEVSVEQFANDFLPEEEKKAFLENVAIFQKIWTHLKESSNIVLPADLHQRECNGSEENTMILDLLPKNPSVIRTVTEYLVKMHNDCISFAIPKENRIIKAGEVKPCHVITCTPEQDFLQAAISNTDYVVNEDGTESTNYNFKTLEDQLVNRFISEKPLINVNTLPMFEFNTVRTLRSFFITVQDQLESLNKNDKNYIMNEFRFLNEISAALATLKIAIGFLQLSFGHLDMLLVDYMKKELRMEDRAKHLDLPVLRTSKVKHIQCLWEVLSARRSVLLVEMNQNPFFMIDEVFHTTISEDVKNTLNIKFAVHKNIDLFITELHDLIMNVEAIEAKPDWNIKETFEPFLDDKKLDEKYIKDFLNLAENLQMKNIVFVWKQAVQRRTV